MTDRLVAGAVLLVVLVFAPSAAPQAEAFTPDLVPTLAAMERKVAALSASMDEVTLRYVRDVHPIEMSMLKRARDPGMARAAAWAIVLEAEERHLSPALVAAVMQIENPWLVTDTTSNAGAVGWMQVMPMHLTDARYNGCGADLTDGPTSVCYGTTILRDYIGRALDDAIRTALNRYNGCVRTPGCEVYADHVLARAQ